MLGQTCHKEFYEHVPGEYQEVSKSLHLQLMSYRLSFFMELIPPSPFIMQNYPIPISEKSPATEKIISNVPFSNSVFRYVVQRNFIYNIQGNESNYSKSLPSYYGI